MANSYIARQRAPFKMDLEDDGLREQVCAMLLSEDDALPLPVAESLFNRILYMRSMGKNITISQELHGGFYGPINRGQLPKFVNELRGNSFLRKRMNDAIDAALAGSDLINGFTDQGLPSDPNGRRQPQIHLGGNVFNDWDGGPGGHAAAAAWREAFEDGAAQEDPRSTVNLQISLNILEPAKLDVDGDYGPLTRAAVKDYQRNHNLAVDGVAGPHTWASIEEQLRAKAVDDPVKGIIEKVADKLGFTSGSS